MNIFLIPNFSLCWGGAHTVIVLEMIYLYHEYELELLYVSPCFLYEFASKGKFS